MRHRRLELEDAELEMTPMIDVTFLLLIFFMCTLRFRTLEGKLATTLPRDVGIIESLEEPPPDPLQVVIRVTDPGTRLFPDGRPYDDSSGAARFEYGPDRELEYRIGPTRTSSLAEAAQGLSLAYERRTSLGDERALRVTLEPAPGTVNGDVVPVLDALALAGFVDVSFAASPED